MSDNQTYWMLEMVQLGKDGRPRYFQSFQHPDGYKTTSDPNAAMRWYTRADARSARDRFLHRSHHKRFRPAEHIFTTSRDMDGAVREHSHKSMSWWHRICNLWRQS